MSNVINFSELLSSDIGWEFEGYKFNKTEISFLIIDAPPGGGPKLHSHPYAEILIIQEGNGRFTLGDKIIEASGGQIIIVPPNTPHKFNNTGSGSLRQIDIHMSPAIITRWL